MVSLSFYPSETIAADRIGGRHEEERGAGEDEDDIEHGCSRDWDFDARAGRRRLKEAPTLAGFISIPPP
jgi:hypothetical protein